MASGFVQVPPDSTGKKMQTFENSVGGNTVEAEAVALVDTTGASILGTAGTPSADVLSIQGVSGGTTIPVTGTITAVTAITNPLPAGTNVIGHVITDSGSVAAVSGAGASGSAVSGNPVLTAGTDGTNARTLLTDTAGNQLTGRSSGANSALAAWTSATTINTTAAVLTNNGEYDSVVITLNQTTTITAGAITFQVSEDGTNWLNVTPNANPTATQNGVYTFVPSTYASFHFGISGFRYFQVVLSTAIIGSGTVTVGYNLQAGTLGKRMPVAITKLTTIETTATLLANAVYTGPWHDTQADGTIFVTASAFANQAAAALGFVIQQTDDPTNTNFTNAVASLGVAASTLVRLSTIIANRYWRIVYTNGASNQGSFELTATAMNNLPSNTGLVSNSNESLTIGQFAPLTLASNGDLNVSGAVASFSNSAGQSSGLDNVVNGSVFVTNASAVAPLAVGQEMYGGAFTGAASATLQGWSRARTPTVFRTVSATASGNTAVWTPGSGNKFRLLKLFVEVTDNASLAAGGVLTIDIQDSSTTTNITFSVFVPTTAVTTVIGDGAEIQLDLGQFGILSAAANNVLNVNLSSALASGVCRIIAMGTEE